MRAVSSVVCFIQYGVGPIGAGIAELAIQRGHQLVGAVDIDPGKAGRPLADLVQGAPRSVTVASSVTGILNAGAEVVLHSTQSRLTSVRPQLTPLLEAGLRVISTCEELAFPWWHHPQEAASLDQLAKTHGSTVVGVGVNPGFVMDVLPVMLTALCRRVDRITVTRVVDVGTRRRPLQVKAGVGLRRDAFERGVADGRIGHVGLPESAAMIAHALKWELERIPETIEPVTGADGRVRGLHQTCTGLRKDTPVIALDLTMAAGVRDPRDAVVIEGDPPVRATLPGGIQGDQATCAIVVNAIPAILTAPPGLLIPTQLWPLSPPRR